MTIFTGGGRRRQTQFISEFEPSTDLVLDAFAEDALKFSPTSSILRAQEQTDAQRGVLNDTGFLGAVMDPLADEARETPITDVVEVEEQGAIIEERFDGAFPIKPVEGMRRGTLELLMDRKEEELANQQVISRASTEQLVAGFGVGVLASVIDPLNIATAFVPVVSPARYAGMLARQTSRTGRALVRARVGALEGAVGAALVEPFVSAQARDEQADYTMADSLLNVAFGTALGGGLHTGIGALSDAVKAKRAIKATGEVAEGLDTLTPQQREDLFRANMALAVADRSGIVPFRLTDIRGNEKITDAGLGDPGTPVKSKFNINERTVTTNEPIPPDIDALAREINPELFQHLDNIRAEQTHLRGLLEDAGATRGEALEATVIDARISELRERQTTANKRKAKKIDKEITDLEAERNTIVAQETPAMKTLRGRLMALDEKLRDIAVEVSDVLRQAESRASQAPMRFGPTQTKTKYTGTGIRFDEVELARIQDVQNLRLADTDYTAKLDEDLLPEGAYENLADAEEGLQIETERLNDILNQMDEADRGFADDIHAEEAEAVRLAIEGDDAYAKGVKALAMCATGKGR